MRLASRLQRALPFYYGWVIAGASGTAVFARVDPPITTHSIFIYPISQEFGWSRTLISGAASAGGLLALWLKRPVKTLGMDSKPSLPGGARIKLRAL